jgi:hypothetical protein
VPGVFRIDHDQAYQQTANFRYQHRKDGLWGDLIWRFDSGLVVTGVQAKRGIAEPCLNGRRGWRLASKVLQPDDTPAKADTDSENAPDRRGSDA